MQNVSYSQRAMGAGRKTNVLQGRFNKCTTATATAAAAGTGTGTATANNNNNNTLFILRYFYRYPIALYNDFKTWVK